MKTSSTPSQSSSAKTFVNGLLNVEQDAALSALDVYTTWLGNVAKAQAELLRFVGERFNKDAQILTQFSACRTPADISRLQLALGTDMINDYAAETQRLISLFTPGLAETPAATNGAAAA